ncbi:MAG: hypothetical protein OEZ58_03685 [Gammaproteobacteria bacterium]|nr:hypothetical protein [Gammaproteobacteria bacterium]MDH5728065.1 hypothetical protein [Gammaproteobacteria bacterium]
MEFDDLDIPSKITEKITLGLSNIGIDVPMGLTQGFMLVLCLAAFTYGIMKLRKEGSSNLTALLIVIGFGLYSVGIAYSWGNVFLNPLPGELEGSVEIVKQNNTEQVDSSYLAMRIELLDLKGESAGLTFGAVDSRSGRFIVKYMPAYFDYPRSLRIKSPGCMPQDIRLKRKALYYVADKDSNIPVLAPIPFLCEQAA